LLTIAGLHALEILDSRGNPTLSVTAELSDGVRASAHVPSGASTGKHEAAELRDGDPDRYAGKGVRRALASVNEHLARELRGLPADDQAGLDRRMIELAGTPNKSRLGANAVLGISCAVARAVGIARGLPLWRSLPSGQNPAMPRPMVNILSGGLHAGKRIEVQDFMAAPDGFDSFPAALEAIVAVHRSARDVLAENGYMLTGVADEGGWGPALPSNEAGLEMLLRAIEKSGNGGRFTIALDIAASHFLVQGGRYGLASEDRSMSSDELIDLLASWVSRYPVSSIEDGLDQDDWDGWARLTARLGSHVQIVGDDLFTTNPARLRRGIEHKCANAVLVKMNQIGTLTETFEVVRIARDAGYATVISARSGETEDSFLADLAVACGGTQIKIGSVTRSERLAKYNRLLEIERELRG
jgi:enolase